MQPKNRFLEFLQNENYSNFSITYEFRDFMREIVQNILSCAVIIINDFFIGNNFYKIKTND